MHSFERNYQVWKKNVKIFNMSLTDTSVPNQNADKCVVFLFPSLRVRLFLDARTKKPNTIVFWKEENCIFQAFDWGSSTLCLRPLPADLYVHLFNLMELNHVPMTRLVIIHSLGLGLEPDFPEVHSHVKRVGTAINWSSSRKWGVGLGEATNTVCDNLCDFHSYVAMCRRKPS